MVLSESFAEKAKVTMSEKIYVPIYDYTLLDSIYTDEDDFIYFPGVGKKVQKKVLCQYFIPKFYESEIQTSGNMKNKVLQLLKSMNIADYFNYKNSIDINQFRKEVVKTKTKDGIVSGFKIHKFSKTPLIDKKLQEILEKLYDLYSGFIIDTYNELNENFNEKFSRQILKRFYVYNETEDNKLNIDNVNIKECIYLLEFEIQKVENSCVGDKFTNRSCRPI